jgi:predicted nuclease of restriction endonuclease-like (RecB) superfamily
MNELIPSGYIQILSELKSKIKQAKSNAALAVNFELLKVYWEIGSTVLEQQKIEGWGTKIIDRLSKDLKSEFTDFQGLSVRNIKYMRSFAVAYPDFLKVQAPSAQLQVTDNQYNIIVQQLVAQLPWSHNLVLLDKLDTIEQRIFYAQKTLENSWSKNVLSLQIQNKLIERQGKAITNFKNTLPAAEADLAKEMLKNPYVFDFLTITEEMKERDVENALITHLKKFILELGRGFAYVGNQFNLNVAGDDFYLDLLFYNTRLHRYVVFELKVGEFKPEYAGKLNFYLNAIDEQIKTDLDAPTIGVLLCKTPNETVIEYALRGIDKPVGVSDYELKTALPENLKSEIPSIEELEKEIEKEVEQLQSPIDSKLKNIKERLRNLKTEEIQTPATYELLQNLFQTGLKPLYQQIIQKMMDAFHEEFIFQTASWTLDRIIVHSIPEFEEFWKKQENLKKIQRLDFSYTLDGFRKSGTESYNEHFSLLFIMDTYSYAFRHTSYSEPNIIKKLYHQPMTQEDINLIIDALVEKVLGRIEWMIDQIENKKI